MFKLYHIIPPELHQFNAGSDSACFDKAESEFEFARLWQQRCLFVCLCLS